MATVKTRTRNAWTRIEGTDALLKLFQDIGEQSGAVLDEAAEAGAKIVLDEAKRRVPVKTGKLRDSIEMKQLKIRAKSTATKGRYAGQLKYSRAYKSYSAFSIGPRYASMNKTGGVNYGHLVELGHKNAKNGKKVKAKPYLRPAVDENKATIASAVSQKIDEVLRRLGFR